jgi:phosphopantetheine--protein transferase-like protein
MLLGVGTDILRIDRMRDCLGSSSFARRTFTPLEMGAAQGRADEAAYYARVFAAKEAVFKCLGLAAEELGGWLEIEIADSEEAQPEVRLRGSVARLAEARHVGGVLLSVSSDTDYALAFAAAVKEGADGD